MSATEYCDSFRATREGFCLYRNGESCRYRDDDVVGIKVSTRRQPDALGRTAVVKSLRIRFDSNEEAVVENELGPQGQDLLKPLEQRVVDQLYLRAIEDLDRGLDVQGEGWRISLVEFVHEKTSSQCDVQQISRVNWDGDDLCLWHEDRTTEPFARVHRSAENATLLYQILRELVEVVESDVPNGAQVGMGQRLGEYSIHHDPAISQRGLAAATGVVLTVILAVLPLNLAAICILALLMVALIVAPRMKGMDETLRVYENGVIWSCGHDEQVLLREQIDSISFSHVGQIGVPREADGVIRFTPKDRDAMPIEMGVTQAMTEGETFRGPWDTMIEFVKARMHDELCRQGNVKWLPGMSIERTGLRLKTDDDSTMVDFENIHSVELSRDQLQLFDANRNLLLQTETRRPNFYPGWLLIEELRVREGNTCDLPHSMKSIS